MDAGKKILLDLFTGSLRFVVPVYQRRYSWGEAQCGAKHSAGNCGPTS